MFSLTYILTRYWATTKSMMEAQKGEGKETLLEKGGCAQTLGWGHVLHWCRDM